MINIFYSDGCKNCMQSDGISKVISVLDKDFDFFKNMTEYEVMKYLRDDCNKLTCKPCLFCGSTAIEISDVKIDEFIYQPDNLYAKYSPPIGFVFMIKITKKNGFVLPVEMGGHKRINSLFMINAFQTLREGIEDEMYKGQIFEWGQIFVCISGKYNYDTGDYKTQIERFQHSGIGRQEVIKAINELIELNPEIFINR